MPVIPLYQSQVGSPDTVRGVNPSLSGAAPIAQGLADVARGLSIAGTDLDRQYAIRKQAEDRQASERARAWAGEQSGSLMLSQLQELDKQQRAAPSGADGFAKNYLDGFDKVAAEAVAAAPDELSKRYLQQHVIATRNQLGGHALDFQFKSGDADVVHRYSNAVDTWGKAVEQDPGQYANAKKSLGETMPGVVPQKRDALTDHATQTLTNAAAASVLDRDPYAVRDATARALGFVAGQTEPGNIDVANIPYRVKNPDGSVSTVRSMSANIDGKEVLLPTIADGRHLSNQEAIDLYKRTGKHLGKFTSPDAATAYAVQLHEDQAQMLDHPGEPIIHKTGVPWVDDAKPAQIKTWNNAAEVKIAQLDGQMKRAEEAREKRAERTVAEMQTLSDKGQYLDARSQFWLLDNTRGTSWADAGLKIIDGQAATAGFANAPAAQRAGALGVMRGAGADPARGTNPEDAKRLTKLETIDTAINAAVAKNPWEAATQYGVLKSAPITPIANVNEALKVADARLATIGPVEAWTGKSESPFQPEEAGQIADLVAKLPAPQAASFLGQLGARIGNSERTAAFAKQVHDKDGTVGLAMAYQGTQTTEGRYASELILAGSQMLKDKVIIPDRTKELSWHKQLADQIRGAYANRQIEDEVLKAAFLIAGAKEGDIDNAVRLATGGGIIDYNGAKVPMPVGYAVDGQSSAEDKFRKAIGSIPPEQLMPQALDGKVYSQGVPMAASVFLENLKDAQLVHAGHGRYNVKAGNSLVTNSQGQRITLTLP